jgi:hypothetical protein
MIYPDKFIEDLDMFSCLRYIKHEIVISKFNHSEDKMIITFETPNHNILTFVVGITQGKLLLYTYNSINSFYSILLTGNDFGKKAIINA